MTGAAMLDLINTFVPGGLTGLFAGISAMLAIIGSFLSGRSSGRTSERNKAMKSTIKTYQVADQVRHDVSGMSETQLEKELAKWSEG